MEILKLTITNSVNDNEYTSYHLVKSNVEKSNFIESKRNEVAAWNKLGPESGHMSRRYLDVESTDLENSTLNDLLFLPLEKVALIFEFIKQKGNGDKHNQPI